ncbi:hypothetical protein [Burkholderia ubonensis]|uniref:hypothetical protein n=1 Tax=Burkholderia ubonensis TaxID=101571 RepID=UPI000AA8BD95|nr:hypothetical protein [Burkholderia ubonensis]
MKEKLVIALLACAGTVASMSACAGVTADELVGTWKSPQSLDSYLVITQTPEPHRQNRQNLDSRLFGKQYAASDLSSNRQPVALSARG